ncbi:platelet-activating factor acetylhydrolase [Lipomyces japonicus]|uniref:platelet-activating factor acetylhydrolase n=1 Tax=Lipomyces japonicus TaxID=56871 RepID=UPI0034CF4EEA
MRFNSLTPKLPEYHGPYAVGTVEVEIPAPWPATYEHIGATVETLLFRVFYPASYSADTKLEHPFWFPENRKEYIKNYITFLGRSERLANLLSLVPFIPNIVLSGYSNLALLDPPEGHKWPVVFFSHGLGGTRNAYSQYCGSLASHGHVVIAPEHRDFTAPVTYVTDFETGVKKEVKYRRLFEFDDVLRILRTFQLTMRTREIISLRKILLDEKRELIPIGGDKPIEFNWQNVDTTMENVIFSGHSFGAATCVAIIKGVYNFLEFLYRHDNGTTRSNQTGKEIAPDFAKPVDRFDEFLRPQPAKSLILLDPWLIPLYESMGIPLTVPTISILSEAFYKWDQNLNLVYQLLSNSACPPGTVPPKKRHLFLTRPSAHHSQSDFALLFPSLTKYGFNLPECTFETQTAVMNMNVRGCLEFLRDQGVTSFDNVETDDKSEGLVRSLSREAANDDENTIISKGYLVADGQIQGWTRLDFKDDVSVVDILEGNI